MVHPFRACRENVFSLRNLRVLCVSAVNLRPKTFTAETPRTQRTRRVLFPDRLFRVTSIRSLFSPGCYPGLKLANAFGVQRTISQSDVLLSVISDPWQSVSTIIKPLHFARSTRNRQPAVHRRSLDRQCHSRVILRACFDNLFAWATCSRANGGRHCRFP